MIKSMTGYGKAECDFQTKKITVEIKSLNSKQLDVNMKMPSIYKEKELDLRNEINREISRGKVDVYVSLDSIDDEMPANINVSRIKGYYKQITEITKDLNISLPEDIITTLVRLPEALKAEKQDLSGEEWSTLLSCTTNALKTLNEFRIQEGKALEKDITEHINLIVKYLDMLEPYESQRVTKLKQKIKQNLNELISSDKVDENRLEQELIYYIEKLDISEEKVRLANHCTYFLECMAEPESNGKKLGFITQEIGREINTIGSKANDADMQKIVVQMKDELEKVKEQVNNIL